MQKIWNSNSSRQWHVPAIKISFCRRDKHYSRNEFVVYQMPFPQIWKVIRLTATTVTLPLTSTRLPSHKYWIIWYAILPQGPPKWWAINIIKGSWNLWIIRGLYHTVTFYIICSACLKSACSRWNSLWLTVNHLLNSYMQNATEYLAENSTVCTSLSC